jgi:YHS domain-containing protein
MNPFVLIPSFSRLLAVVCLILLPSTSGFAAEEVNVNADNVVIDGFDVVAYFTEKRAVKGSGRYSHNYRGAIFHFASQDHLDMFRRDPEAYMPAYGGFCSYGVRVGKKLSTNPNAWVIADGRLFLQLDRGTRSLWLDDRERNIAIADRIWPSILSTPKDML